MITVRENYLMAARGQKPLWVPSFTEDCNVLLPDFWNEINPDTGTDFCNVKWDENDYGKMPLNNWHAMKDISQWRETIRFPDPAKMDWEGMVQRVREAGSADRVNMGLLNTHGIFLIPVNMLGWEDALCTIYENPEELEACTAAITDFLCEVIQYMGKYFHPDIISSGDDVASSTGPFLSKEVWKSMYKPYFKKINDMIKEVGALAEFHCCGNCQYLIEEFLDIGVDICQLPEPNDSLLRDKERFGNQLVITGGWDRHGPGCVPGAPEEVVRESVRKAIDVYGKDGSLIFWDGGICGTSDDAKQKMEWVMDELHVYGKKVY